MTRNLLVAVASAAGFVLVACAGNTVDLGGQKDAGTGASPLEAGVDAQGSPLSGTYKGYLESFMFNDGSDTVVMKLTFATNGTVTGTVFFGDGPALAPPTDPDVGYPPGYGLTPLGPIPPLERFDFTVLGGTYVAPRLTLRIQSSEVWKAWCGLQTVTYPQYGGLPDGGCGGPLGYGCGPSGSAGRDTGGCVWSSCNQTPSSVDCGKMAPCAMGGVCTCTATSCTVPLGTGPDVAFDMQLVSGALNGSVTGIVGGGQPLTVHLTKH